MVDPTVTLSKETNAITATLASSLVTTNCQRVWDIKTYQVELRDIEANWAVTIFVALVLDSKKTITFELCLNYYQKATVSTLAEKLHYFIFNYTVVG